MERILLVDDESDLAEAVAFSLDREGFRTEVADDGAAALAALRRRPLPDLVLLDWMLPDMAGTQVLRAMKADPDLAAIPVIMVSARGEEVDRIVGFELGVDDYVVKPFSNRELALRIRAVLRRRSAPPAPPEAAPLRFGPIALDTAAHRCEVDGREVPLTALEFRLLETFLRHPGRALTRERLLEDVWEVRAALRTRTVDTHVKRLRRKLGEAGRYIETLRGVGYRFADRP